jgi:hypothetical protein
MEIVLRSATCARFKLLIFLVELSGIEPLTSSLRTRRSPN